MQLQMPHMKPSPEAIEAAEKIHQLSFLPPMPSEFPVVMATEIIQSAIDAATSSLIRQLEYEKLRRSRPAQEECPRCNGDGKTMLGTGNPKHPLQAVDCPLCGGTGKVESRPAQGKQRTKHITIESGHDPRLFSDTYATPLRIHIGDDLVYDSESRPAQEEGK